MNQLKFSHDEFGKEILLKGDLQVMMEWEKPYMEACIDALHITPKDTVLEVGFGCGYAATRIAHYKPKSHTIIECDKEVLVKAHAFAKAHPHVQIIEESWQKALSTLGKFDVCFFDDYPLPTDRELQRLQNEGSNASLIVEAGRKKMREMEQILPSLRTTVYSNQDLDEFFNALAAEQKDGKLLYRFFIDLEARGQINKNQCEHLIDRLVKEKLLSAEALQEKKRHYKPSFEEVHVPGDRLFLFLESCLKSHMNLNARFSCYVKTPTSKYEDLAFYEKIISNPYLDYTEKLIPVQVPKNCTYYAGDKALVITITKRA